MSCHPQESNNHNHFHYNIQNIKPRFIPTYLHQQVFVNRNEGHMPIRCTPTFHSSAMNTQGYQPITNQHLKHNQKPTKAESTTTYMNRTNLLRQKDLNPNHNCFNGNSKIEWYDNAKMDLFANIRCGSARQRKIADLSSNPVFGGSFFMPQSQTNNQCRDNKLIPVQQPKIELKQSVKDINQQQIEEGEPNNNQQNNISQNASKNQQNKQYIQSQPTQNHKPFDNSQLPKNIQQLIQQQVQQQLKNLQLSLQKDTKRSSNQRYCEINKLNQDKTLVKRPQSTIIIKQQQFNLNNDVTFGKKNDKIGRKLNKTVIIGAQRPTFTVIRNK